ncbi:hypothetical protein V5O48_011814 [Marasmius crinis-equi]|uniref:MYND-type domain-containing protein n=1 Tax=Marasmius crinis-equi TaxID=585013 RepID=A0ABR3F4K2_9AGAR
MWSPDSASQDLSFFYQASDRYPTIDRALQALRQLGPPPVVNGPVDSSVFENSTSKSWTCLYILGALACDMDPANRSRRPSIPHQIKRHWSSHLYAWIRYFLQAVRTPDVLEPSNGYQVAEYILQSLPSILMYPTAFPEPQKHTEMALLVDSSPAIRDLVLGVWLMVLSGEYQHRFWLSWTRATNAIFQDLRDTPLPTQRQITDFYSKWDISVISAAFIHSLKMQTPRIRKMDDKEMADVYSLHTLRCMEGAVPGDPVSMCPFPRFSIPVQAEFISALIRRRQRALAHQGSVQDENSHPSKTINNLILINLADVVHILEERGRVFIDELLETRLVVDLVRADDLDQDALGKGRSTNRVVLFMVRLFDLISRNLVYPSVLHGFLRIVKVVERLGIEEEKKGDHWWQSWAKCKQKAYLLREVRRLLREEVETVCSFGECPLRSKVSSEEASRRAIQENLRSNYRFCSHCLVQSYCSSECQRLDRKNEHRGSCKKYSEAINRGNAQVSHRDRRFIHRVMKTLLDERIDKIRLKVVELPPPKYPVPGPHQALRPVVFIDIDHTEVTLTEEHLRVTHLGDLLEEDVRLKKSMRWVKEFLQKYHDLKEDSVAVILLGPSPAGVVSGPLLMHSSVKIHTEFDGMDAKLRFLDHDS